MFKSPSLVRSGSGKPRLKLFYNRSPCSPICSVPMMYLIIIKVNWQLVTRNVPSSLSAWPRPLSLFLARHAPILRLVNHSAVIRNKLDRPPWIYSHLSANIGECWKLNRPTQSFRTGPVQDFYWKVYSESFVHFMHSVSYLIYDEVRIWPRSFFVRLNVATPLFWSGFDSLIRL